MKKKLYIVEWPNETISIVSADNKNDLFWNIDSESDPCDAKITEVSFDGHQDIYIKTESESKITWDLNWDIGGGKKKVVQNEKKSFFNTHEAIASLVE